MKTLVFLLEEMSAKTMLEELIKTNFDISDGKISFRYIVHEGKQDLEKSLERKIRGWLVSDSYFFVIRDQDAGDCAAIKSDLREKCISAGRSDAVIRIACRELESFYLGDLEAVEKGLDLRGIARHQGNKKYRDPDHLSSPAMELERLTRGKYQKIDGSRKIARCMNPSNNSSHSFKVFYRSLREIIEGAPEN